MKRITQDELDEVLRLHKLWGQDDPDGVRAVLDDTDLSGLNMDRASMNRASMNRASLDGASLGGASMNWASLDGASLDGAFLYRASLIEASLNCASLNRAFLNMASLDGASLYRASMVGALMNGIQGNMAEIKSAHFDRWPIAWFQPRGLSVRLQIGCQQHDLEWWEAATDEQIDCLDPHALGWWRRYRDIVLGLALTSPAVVSGGVDAEAGE